MDTQNGIEIPEGMTLDLNLEEDEANVQGQKKEESVISPEQKKGTYFLGSKKFDSAEDRDQYAAELNEKVIRYEAEREAAKPSETYNNANQVDPSDLMFSDPKAYTQIIQEDAVKKAVSIIEKRDSEKRVWDNFYSNYSDLKDKDLAPMVEFQFNKAKNDNPNLPADQLLDKIGKEVRNLIGKVKGKPDGGKELPGGAAIVAGATNNNTPTKVAPVVELDDMATQLRKLRKRGK